VTVTLDPDRAATGTITSGAPPRDRRWLALAVIALAQLMVVLDATIVNIALPSVQRDLGFSDDSRQWIVTGYSLAFGGLLLLGGRLADLLGRKRMFLIGLIGFAAASGLGGIAPNVGLLITARALQGAFGAVLAPAALALLTVAFTEPRERARAFGVYGAIAGGGAAVGLLLGGILTEYASWRWCLLVNIPIALIAAAAAPRLVRESRSEHIVQLDVPGAVSVTGGLAALVYGFTQAQLRGWSSVQTVTWLLLAVVLLVSFVAIELRTTSPLLPLRVVLDRNRGGSFLASLLSGSGLFAMFFFLTFYLQNVQGYSAIKSGLAFLPFSAGIIISAGLASQVLPRLGPRLPMTLGLVAAGAGMLYLGQLQVGSSYVAHVLPAFALVSLGLGFVFVPLSSTALVGVADRDAGVASAVVNTTQQIGGALGTALLSTIAATAATAYARDHRPGGTSRESLRLFGLQAQTHSFTVAFLVGAALVLVAAVSTSLLVRAGRDDIASVPSGGGAPA